jgi:GNAT superfamily N-acetyltransferase
MEIKLATPVDIQKLIPTLLELRPHLQPEEMKERILSQMKDGFQLAYVGNDHMAFAVAGFRMLDFLFSGKTLYVDDLVTHPEHRKNGYAGMLMRWMIEYARKNQADHFSLDSGTHRKDAHRFYLKHGLDITAFHFAKNLKDLP